MKKGVSDAVIRRLPRYYRYLDELHNKGVVRIWRTWLFSTLRKPRDTAAVCSAPSGVRRRSFPGTMAAMTLFYHTILHILILINIVLIFLQR